MDLMLFLLFGAAVEDTIQQHIRHSVIPTIHLCLLLFFAYVCESSLVLDIVSMYIMLGRYVVNEKQGWWQRGNI